MGRNARTKTGSEARCILTGWSLHIIRPELIAEDKAAALNTVIPAALWEEMREQKLVASNAPLPINVK